MELILAIFGVVILVATSMFGLLWVIGTVLSIRHKMRRAGLRMALLSEIVQWFGHYQHPGLFVPSVLRQSYLRNEFTPGNVYHIYIGTYNHHISFGYWQVNSDGPATKYHKVKKVR